MAQMLMGKRPEEVRDEIAAWLEWIGRGQERTFKDVAAELRTIPAAPWHLMEPDEEDVQRVATALLDHRGFGFYTNPMEAGQDAYDISCQALEEARAVLKVRKS